MTNISGGGPNTPQGWYPDAEGAMRWWDGSRWTEHTQATSVAGQGGASAPVPTVAAKPWFKKKRWWVVAAVLIVLIGVGTGGGADEPNDQAPVAADSRDRASEDGGSKAAPDTDSEPEPEPAPEPEPEPEPALSVAQENAVRSAESYLDLAGFSRSGLIEQLEFEGYSSKDATLAVDALDVSWNEQATRSAESYLELTGFSRSGLIDQLVFEGYSRPQAEHAADQVGL